MAESVRIGSVDVHVLLDFTAPARETTDMYPDVKPEMWAPYRQYLDPNGKLPMNFCGFLVRSAGRTVLVDTGMGAGPHERFGGIAGRFLEAMGRHGVKPEDVDTVLHTHIHADHVGWNVTKVDGKPAPTFPKARYLFPKADYEFHIKPENLPNAPYVPANVTPVLEMGRGELIRPDYDVTPELKTLAAPGHTPGHTCVLISSQGRQCVIIGDLIHNPVQVSEPDWLVRPDIDKVLARQSRASLLGRFEREKTTVMAAHVQYGKSIGMVVREGSKRYWKAL